MKHHTPQVAKHANLQHCARRNLLKFRQGNEHWQKPWQKKITSTFLPSDLFITWMMPWFRYTLARSFHFYHFYLARLRVPEDWNESAWRMWGVQIRHHEKWVPPTCWEVKQIEVIRWNEYPKNVRCTGRPCFFSDEFVYAFWPKAFFVSIENQNQS